MRRVSGWLCLLSILLGAGRAAGQTISDRAVDQAIKGGVRYLWSLQKADGSFPGHGGYPAGPGSLIVYALLESGVNPQEPRMVKALNWLATIETDRTYTLGIRCQVWLAANRGTAGKYRKNLKADVQMLIKSTKDGSYGYGCKGKGQSSGDHSNSQYGLLGVWAGALDHLEGIPPSYWLKVFNHWVDNQMPDGGWPYGHWSGPKDGQEAPASTHTMTVAGIASIFVCLDNRFFAAYRDCKARGIPLPLKRGLRWLDDHFAAGKGWSGGWPYYYMYGLERVGLASGYKYFGNVDWYKSGAKRLLARQGGGGNWGSSVDTSFALLFLIRGRRSVLFNKLQRTGDWRNRPRDLAALTRWLSRKLEEPVNWQIINLKVPVREWHDAPILYITGAAAPTFTEEEMQKLRTFVWQGGTIFSIVECNDSRFRKGIRAVYQKLFPRYELQRVNRPHSLYSLHYPLKGRPTFHMIGNGVRPFAIHADTDLAQEYQLNRFATRKWAFQAAANVAMYVTDKGKLRARGTAYWPRDAGRPDLGNQKIARLRHAGQWDPEPLAFERFGRLMAKRTGVGVEVLNGVPIEKLLESKADLAILAGTSALKLSAAEKKTLNDFVAGGGCLLVEAVGGSKSFAESARVLFRDENMFGGEGPERITEAHPVLNVRGYKITKATYRRRARRRIGAKRTPNLQVITMKGRDGVFYSREDITLGLLGVPVYDCDGYAPESAYEILRNIVLHVADQKIRAQASRGEAAADKAADAEPTSKKTETKTKTDAEKDGRRTSSRW